MTESAASGVKLVGGDPALDFVNTVGGRTRVGARRRSLVRDDKLDDYRDLVAWALHAGLLGEAAARRLLGTAQRRPREAARVFGRAGRLREALHRVLRSLMDGRLSEAADLAVLNAELGAVRRRERLAPAPEGLRWQLEAGSDRLDSVLRAIGRAAAALLASPDIARLRECAGDGCGWLFLDRSKNRSRQWCTMEDCGNVSKVRRFRQRLRKRER
jgi:predicted RNA-binding Zn ribbon-like protein